MHAALHASLQQDMSTLEELSMVNESSRSFHLSPPALLDALPVLAVAGGEAALLHMTGRAGAAAPHQEQGASVGHNHLCSHTILPSHNERKCAME